MAPLFPFLLAAAPYFFTQGPALYRAELELSPAQGSGATPVARSTRARVELPGAVVAYAQRDGEAVAVACRALPPTDALPGCPVFHVDGRGAVTALPLSGYSAELLPGNAEVLVWTDALELLRHALATGATARVATSVLEPRLSADGRQVAFARASGLTRLTPGFVACPFALELAGGEARRLPGPCHAQAPFLSPQGSALYVSTQGGLAGLVLDGRRVSGTGAGDFVPVPGRELVWLDAARAVYTAHYGEPVLWLFDARDGSARPLAQGREPALLGGRLVAAQGDRVVQVEVGP